jgi:hypothetical protein
VCPAMVLADVAPQVLDVAMCLHAAAAARSAAAEAAPPGRAFTHSQTESVRDVLNAGLGTRTLLPPAFPCALRLAYVFSCACVWVTAHTALEYVEAYMAAGHAPPRYGPVDREASTHA